MSRADSPITSSRPSSLFVSRIASQKRDLWIFFGCPHLLTTFQNRFLFLLCTRCESLTGISDRGGFVYVDYSLPEMVKAYPGT
jgi:hypothetical protein